MSNGNPNVAFAPDWSTPLYFVIAGLGAVGTGASTGVQWAAGERAGVLHDAMATTTAAAEGGAPLVSVDLGNEVLSGAPETLQVTLANELNAAYDAMQGTEPVKWASVAVMVAFGAWATRRLIERGGWRPLLTSFRRSTDDAVRQ